MTTILKPFFFVFFVNQTILNNGKYITVGPLAFCFLTFRKCFNTIYTLNNLYRIHSKCACFAVFFTVIRCLLSSWV